MSGKKGNDKGNQSRQDLAALRDARDAARMRVDYVAPPPQPHPNEQVTDDVARDECAQITMLIITITITMHIITMLITITMLIITITIRP